VYLPAVAPPLAFAGLGDDSKGIVIPAVNTPNVANVWSMTTRRDNSIGTTSAIFFWVFVLVDDTWYENTNDWPNMVATIAMWNSMSTKLIEVEIFIVLNFPRKNEAETLPTPFGKR
jgi:hypothetical protein